MAESFTLGGITHTVKPMSMEMFAVVLEKDRDVVDKLLTIVADRAPTLTREEIEGLTVAQLEAIANLSIAAYLADGVTWRQE